MDGKIVFKIIFEKNNEFADQYNYVVNEQPQFTARSMGYSSKLGINLRTSN